MPPDWDARRARREALAGSRRRGAREAQDGEVIASDGALQEHAEESLNGQPTVNGQPTTTLSEPGWPDGRWQSRVTQASIGSPRAAALDSRLARWRPTLWPLFLAFVIDLVIVGWYTMPFGGLLGWPLTVLWTWPILTSIIGIVGIRRTRKAVRRSKARWSDEGLTKCEDFLIVVVSTIGRRDTYPALERSVLSYLAYLPSCFPRLRIDVVIDEGSEATSRIESLVAGSDLMRLVTVPKWYRTPNGTRFKARASHYSHELRIR